MVTPVRDFGASAAVRAGSRALSGALTHMVVSGDHAESRRTQNKTPAIDRGTPTQGDIP